MAGFQNLDSHSKSASQPIGERDAESGESSREEASIGAYDSDHELTAMEAPRESRVGRVKVQTEVRQEVQRIKSPNLSGRERNWGNDIVSTEITAKGS